MTPLNGIFASDTWNQILDFCGREQIQKGDGHPGLYVGFRLPRRDYSR